MFNQIYILIAFFISGVLIGILFDIFRITRKVFNVYDLFVYIQDIFFWILSGCIILFTIFTFTTGEIRLYMIISLILGAFIYFMSISKYFISINVKIINTIKNIIINICKVPINIIYKIYLRIKNISKNCKVKKESKEKC